MPLFEVIQPRTSSSHALVDLGGMASQNRQQPSVQRLYGRSLALAESFGNSAPSRRRSRASAPRHITARIAQARSFYEDSVTLFHGDERRLLPGPALVGFALAAHEAGDREQADAQRVQRPGFAARLGRQRPAGAWSLGRLGRAVLGRSRRRTSSALLQQSLGLWVNAQLPRCRDQPGRAGERVAEARAQRPAIALRCSPRPGRGADRARSALGRRPEHLRWPRRRDRAQLDPSAARDTAWSEGMRTSVDETIACAQVPSVRPHREPQLAARSPFQAIDAPAHRGSSTSITCPTSRR